MSFIERELIRTEFPPNRRLKEGLEAGKKPEKDDSERVPPIVLHEAFVK